uniref:Uncharacterized protein n=1 Tax=Panagrellus redivivus TaxID=6233 RepID=A0A7E4VF19_PANRE
MMAIGFKYSTTVRSLNFRVLSRRRLVRRMLEQRCKQSVRTQRCRTCLNQSDENQRCLTLVSGGEMGYPFRCFDENCGNLHNLKCE